MYEKLVFKDFQANYTENDRWDLSHKHASYEILMVDKGEKTVYVGKRSYLMKPGYVFLLYPDIPHKYIGKEPYSKYEITFTNKFLDMFFTNYMKKRLLRCYTSEVLKLTEDETEQFKDIFNEIVRQKDEGEDYPIQLGRLLGMLNASSERSKINHILPETSGKEVTALVNVVSYINGHYRSIHSIDEIAKECFISKSYLCNVFKEEYGMTVMDYLRKVRIKKACDFLATTDKNLSLIATKMGFVDLSHFTRVFKKEMGVSPKEYRTAKKQERIDKENADKENADKENTEK